PARLGEDATGTQNVTSIGLAEVPEKPWSLKKMVLLAASMRASVTVAVSWGVGLKKVCVPSADPCAICCRTPLASLRWNRSSDSLTTVYGVLAARPVMAVLPAPGS